jgi:Na+:H+ antiporter, NhaA family
MKSFRDLAASPTISGVVLLLASLFGLLLANSGLSELYFAALHAPLGGRIGPLNFDLTVGHWISDGLMTLFFLGVTLEIKREVTVGHLDSVGRAVLPAIGAVGGMIGPALIYIVCVRQDAEALRGWAIPAATDAAFTLPLVAALGSRIPPAVRAFLIALAIFDDVLAILIIASFYSFNLSMLMLSGATLAVATLISLNLSGVRRLPLYVLVGLLLWAAMLQSGIHATLAGVLLGLCIPSGNKEDAAHGQLLLQRFDHAIQPYVALLILPVFGFANGAMAETG